MQGSVVRRTPKTRLVFTGKPTLRALGVMRIRAADYCMWPYTHRLHSQADDSKCLTWFPQKTGCANYGWGKCKKIPNGAGRQVFHVSRFMDDKDDTDVFNWAGADGRAMDAGNCLGFKDGNTISHCTDNQNQAKRWKMLVTDVELTTWTAHLDGRNGVHAHDYEFKRTSLTSKSGTYSNLMLQKCKSLGMKPVWYVTTSVVASLLLACWHYMLAVPARCHTPAITQATVRTTRRLYIWAKRTT